MTYLKSALLALALASVAVSAQAAPKKPVPAAPAVQPKPDPDEAAPFTHTAIEIYRIAPGQQQAFLEFIAKCDEANRIAGLAPRQLYVHSDGDDWDFILVQPEHTPADKAAALDKAWDQVGLPSGANFFFEIRKYIASHSDTDAIGPTTAKAYLDSMKK